MVSNFLILDLSLIFAGLHVTSVHSTIMWQPAFRESSDRETTLMRKEVQSANVSKQVLNVRPEGRNSRIPKIIWVTEKSRDKLKPGFIELLQRLNPQHDVRFYDDDAVVTFIKDAYPECLSTYQKIAHPAHRADFWRYLVLLKHGGYYIDADNQPVMTMENIADGYDFVSVISATAVHGVHVHNGFIGSTPGNFVLKHLVEHFKRYPNPPAGYPMFGYHFYVRHFYVWLQNYFGSLNPLVSYSAEGIRMMFLYCEPPRVYAIDGNANIALLIGYLKEHQIMEHPTLPHGFPEKMNLKTKKWHPVTPPKLGSEYFPIPAGVQASETVEPWDGAEWVDAVEKWLMPGSDALNISSKTMEVKQG